MKNELNYQKWLSALLADLNEHKIKPKLLLHACCAPCSTHCLMSLNKFFDITILFYNPNIFPSLEYDRRLQELHSFLSKIKSNIKVLEFGHNNLDYTSKIKGFENEKEGGKRCELCFYLRLNKTGEIAKEYGFDYFTTSLTISPYKNSQLLNKIGKEMEEKYGVKYLFSDFKKDDGYKKSIILSKQFDLYRQDYCGCIYSKNEHDEKIKSKKKIDKDVS